jgi:hypothetical protein
MQLLLQHQECVIFKLQKQLNHFLLFLGIYEDDLTVNNEQDNNELRKPPSIPPNTLEDMPAEGTESLIFRMLSHLGRKLSDVSGQEIK